MANAGAGGGTPLRLKDLLELDCDSCSAAGFRCYPRRLGEAAAAPMRHLLLESSPSLLSLRRRRPSKLSHLSRSLSRRLSISRGGFWRRRDEEDEPAAATAAAASSTGRGGSCSEEPETSSSETSDNSSGSGTTSRRSRSSSGSDFSTSASEEDSVHDAAALAAGDEHDHDHEEAMKRGSSSSSGSEVDDKEQLSPVAVMDFPFDDDEPPAAAACSPSFSLERLQRRNKIRRFGSRDDELGPVDLDARFAATSDIDDVTAQHQQVIQCHHMEDAATPTCASGSGHRGAGGVHGDVPDEHGLLSLLMGAVQGGVDAASERLLLDFVFVETKRRRSSEPHAEGGLAAPPAGMLRRKAEWLVDGGDGEAVEAARGWLEGTGAERWGLQDVLSAGEAVVAEMERGRRWMQVGEEEREVGAVVAGMLVDQLLDEVVWDLLV